MRYSKAILAFQLSSLAYALIVLLGMKWLASESNGFLATENSVIFQLGVSGSLLYVCGLTFILLNIALSVRSFLIKNWLVATIGLVICVPIYVSSSYVNEVYFEFRKNPCRFDASSEICITMIMSGKE